MFNMKNVGRKISLLRKERNLTQMELADMLNISYQAVSNWERGETMPDISKLPEIAQIFDTSIDNILGNNSTTRLVNNIINTDLSNDIIAIDEFKSITPILKPTQISEISNKVSDSDDMNDLLEYIPFVSKTVADKIAKKCIEKEQIFLDELLPFISIECADNLVDKAIELNYSINVLLTTLPFISTGIADKIAKKCIENNYISLDELVPFISQDLLEELIRLKIQMIK